MTDIKQVRAYLWRVRDAERELKLLEQEYEQAKADILHLKAIQYDADKVSGGLIEKIADGRYREVLKRRYLWGESWEYIAIGLGYEYHHVHKLHGQALNEFKAILQSGYKWIQRPVL